MAFYVHLFFDHDSALLVMLSHASCGSGTPEARLQLSSLCEQERQLLVERVCGGGLSEYRLAYYVMRVFSLSCRSATPT